MSEPEPLVGQKGAKIDYNLTYLQAPGVRFDPTERELIADYLQRKLRGEPPPYADAISDDDHDVYSEHPKDLVRKLRIGFVDSWYLFSPRDRKYAGGERPRRSTDDGVGFWKSTEAQSEVLGGAHSREVIGYKRRLTYHVFVDVPAGDDDDAKLAAAQKKKKKPKPKSKPTDWKMVELVSINTDRPADKTAADNMRLNDYVLCKIMSKTSEVEVQDPAPGLPQSTEKGMEEQGAPPDEQQQATPEAPIEGEGDTAAAAAAELQQTGPGDSAQLGSDANTLDYDGLSLDDYDLNWLMGNRSSGMPSIFDLDEDIGTVDIAGEAQPASQQLGTSAGDAGRPEQQQSTSGTENRAATAAEDTSSISVSPKTLAMPGGDDRDAWFFDPLNRDLFSTDDYFSLRDL